MSDAQISAYADAAYGIAAAEGNTAEVEDELFRLGRTLLTNDELRSTLSDAHLPVERRAQIVEDLLDGKATRTTVSFASMLVASGRIGDLPAIADELARRSAAAKGQTVAEVRSAVALTEAQAALVARYVDAFEKMTLAPAFLVILVVLLVRPQGIFGRKVVSRV